MILIAGAGLIVVASWLALFLWHSIAFVSAKQHSRVLERNRALLSLNDQLFKERKEAAAEIKLCQQYLRCAKDRLTT